MVLGLLLLFEIAGCSRGPGAMGPPWVEWDSAGVSVVQSNLPLSSGDEEWSVSHSPSVVIETDPFHPNDVLHWVRGAIRLSDDRIAVISESTKDLRIFSSSGELSRVVGGEGDGPGEFRSPFQLTRLPGDTLVVTERGTDRRSWFTSDGAYIRRSTPDRGKASDLVPAGFFLGFGRFVPPSGVLWEIEELGLPPVGKRVRTSKQYLYSPGEGAEPVNLGEFGGREYFYLREGVGRWAFFSRDTYSATSQVPTRIYLGDSESYEIRVFDSFGGLFRIIRDTQPPPAIEGRDIEWERWELLDWGETSKRSQEFSALAQAMPIPGTKPAFEDLIVDSEGCLWVMEYSSYKPEKIRYRVFSPGGRRVGVVHLPGRFRVFDIGYDYVLGLRYDLNYVERIESYELDRPDPDWSGT